MNVDWRPFLLPVKDQGDCGSCVAHGVNKTWEGEIRVKAGDEGFDIDLSERHLFSCCGGTCDSGTTMEAALNQALTGVALEQDCLYDARDHECGEGLAEDWWKRGKKMASWFTVSSFEEIKKRIEEGPLAATMAVHQSFMNYKSGIYHNLGVFDPIVGYHCICLAAKNEGEDYCVIRNSWTEDWGEKGDCRMKWSELDDAAFKVIPSNDPLPEPEPSPSPCPYSIAVVRLPGGRWFLRNYRRLRKALFGIEFGIVP